MKPTDAYPTPCAAAARTGFTNAFGPPASAMPAPARAPSNHLLNIFRRGSDGGCPPAFARSLLTPYVLAALSLPMGFAAQAAPVVLASSQLFGGESQSIGSCYISNDGSTNASITSYEIVDQTGTSLSLFNNTCTPTLAAGATCFFSANFNADFSHACLVTLPEANTAIRASAEIRDGNDNPLNYRDLH